MKVYKKIISCVLILTLSFVLVGCDFINQLTCVHDYQIIDTKEATCTEDGYEERICSLCNHTDKKTIKAKGHIFNDPITIKEPSSTEHGLKTYECKVCKFVKEEIIDMYQYLIANTFLKQYDFTETIGISSIESFASVFESAIFNRIDSLKCQVYFSYQDINSLLDYAKNAMTIENDFSVSIRSLGNNMTLTFTYPELPSKQTSHINSYIPLNNVSYTQNLSSRPASYDEFKINNSKYSYTVSTSEQLYYCLERMVKPLPVPGSSAEILYNKIKGILRNIISDDMTEVEKAKEIHDYVIMNVIYDNELASINNVDQMTLKTYNGFYLEGVFNDGYAVCDGISKAIVAMANIEGIPCVQVTGKQLKNPNAAGHAWNKIMVNNNWYILDATADGTILDQKYEILSYEYFLVDDTSIKSKYTEDKYEYIVCDKKYDIFKDITYCDKPLLVSSRADLEKVVVDFYKNSNAHDTIQFKKDFSHVLSISSIISEIRSKNGLRESCLIYVSSTNNNIILLMKE